MTYKKLLELIEQMSAEQQEMDVLFATSETNHIATMLTQILVNEDEGEDALPVGQPILS